MEGNPLLYSPGALLIRGSWSAASAVSFLPSGLKQLMKSNKSFSFCLKNSNEADCFL